METASDRKGGGALPLFLSFSYRISLLVMKFRSGEVWEVQNQGLSRWAGRYTLRCTCVQYSYESAGVPGLQGYLTYKKTYPPRSLP